MSGCEKYQELISRLIDEDLDEKEHAELTAHLKNCKECALMVSAFTGLSAALSSDLEEVPEALHENMMAAVRRSHMAAQNRRKFVKRVKKYSVAACLALIVLVAAGAGKLFGARFAKSAMDMDTPADQAAPAEAPCSEEEPQAEGYGCVSGSAADGSEAAGDGRIRVEPGLGGAADPNGVSAQAAETTEGEAETVEAAMDTASRQLNCSWEELSAFLGGETCDTITEQELAPFLDCVLSLSEEEASGKVYIYVLDGTLYYYTEAGRELYRAACSPEAFADYIKITIYRGEPSGG